MVPKLLHYCWFGAKPLPSEYARYIDGWRSIAPDYSIIEWNDYTLPSTPYIERAYKYGKWANLANYMRFYALAKMGGIYLDTDIEMVKSFDHLLDNGMFAGWQGNGQINNAVLGARPAHPFIVRCLEELPRKFDGTERATLSSPHLMTRKLFDIYSIASTDFDTLVEVKGARIYPTRYFYPYWLGEQFDRATHVTADTVCIHHWAATWVGTLPVFEGTRTELLDILPKGMRWLEVGVARGNFSEHIIKRTAPAKLTLVDLWRQQPLEVYDDKANTPDALQERIYNYVLKRFEAERATGLVDVIRDYSTTALRRMRRGTVDCVYLDANHAYSTTLADLTAAAELIADDGVIMGHDYCGGDDAGHVFGVMTAVSEFLRHHVEFKLAGITNEQYATYILVRDGHPLADLRKYLNEKINADATAV